MREQREQVTNSSSCFGANVPHNVPHNALGRSVSHSLIQIEGGNTYCSRTEISAPEPVLWLRSRSVHGRSRSGPKKANAPNRFRLQCTLGLICSFCREGSRSYLGKSSARSERIRPGFPGDPPGSRPLALGFGAGGFCVFGGSAHATRNLEELTEDSAPQNPGPSRSDADGGNDRRHEGRLGW